MSVFALHGNPYYPPSALGEREKRNSSESAQVDRASLYSFKLIPVDRERLLERDSKFDTNITISPYTFLGPEE